MKTRIVRIGNSRGIRLPKPILEQTGLQDEVELDVQDDTIIIRAVKQPRTGWEVAFEEMSRRGDDRLVHGDQLQSSTYDEEEWQW